MTILLTGVTGFVGRHLAATLLAAGHRVAGVAWEDAPPAVPGVELVKADVLDLPALTAAFERFAPEAVVHLAGLAHVGESWGRMGEYFQVNVVGADHVLRAARRVGGDGVRVVLASSAEVYGPVPEAEQPIPESRPVDPRSPYGLTKAAAERLVLAAADRGQQAVVVRAFNLIGAGQAKNFALPSFAGQLAAIRCGTCPPVLKVGNLSARRDFVHIEDAAEALALIVARSAAGDVVNLASGRAWTIAEALDRLIAESGLAVRVEVDPERVRPVDQPLLCGDGTRLRALGWVPGRGVEAALADLWAEAMAESARGDAA
jgi:GDP-4-dehydro-6-deoxy-D-mannose reductase